MKKEKTKLKLLTSVLHKMKISTKIVLIFLALNLCSCRGSAQDTETEKLTPKYEYLGIENSAFPKPVGIINDYGQVFTESQQAELSKILYDYYMETTRQVVVVTIDSIKPYQNIQKYATNLGQSWGVGTAENNNGLTIVLCKSCREIGIATGTGTELILTDQICKEVINEKMIPEFKNEAFYAGIKSGVLQLIKKWE